MVDAIASVQGVSPVLEVPFTAEGKVDFEGFRNVVRHTRGCGVTSLMFPGFASEFHKLSDSERERLRDVLLEEVAGSNVGAIVAVQDHATYQAMNRAREAVAKGADCINLLPPYFLDPSQAQVFEHIEMVVDAVAPTPVILQHTPRQTGASLDAAAIAGLARAHPNIQAVKVESTPPGSFVSALARQDPPLPAVTGYAGVHMPDAVRRGAVGVQPGCSFTEIFVAIWDHLAHGDEEAAHEIYRKLLPYTSYWMQGIELIVAAEKLISHRRGLINNPHCRAPAHSLDTEEAGMVDRFLAEFADLIPRTTT